MGVRLGMGGRLGVYGHSVLCVTCVFISLYSCLYTGEPRVCQSACLCVFCVPVHDCVFESVNVVSYFNFLVSIFGLSFVSAISELLKAESCRPGHRKVVLIAAVWLALIPSRAANRLSLTIIAPFSAQFECFPCVSSTRISPTLRNQPEGR